MSEKLKRQDDIILRLRNRVAEIKDDAVASWKVMEAQDALKAYIGGNALVIAGILFTAAGKNVDLWPVQAGGAAWAFMGLGSAVTGYVKMIELGSRKSSKVS